VVRQGYLLAVVLMVLLVALLYSSPAYGHASRPPSVPVTSAGQHLVSVKAGTPVTVLRLYRDPGESRCTPPNAYPCRLHTFAVTQLPDGKVVLVHHKAIDYTTQTVRVDTNAAGPLTLGEVNDFLRLSDTGGVALLPLLGAIMLIGGGLVVRRALTVGFQGEHHLATVAEYANQVGG
jgi:hypothetical protein